MLCVGRSSAIANRMRDKFQASLLSKLAFPRQSKINSFIGFQQGYENVDARSLQRQQLIIEPVFTARSSHNCKARRLTVPDPINIHHRYATNCSTRSCMFSTCVGSGKPEPSS